MSSRVEFMDFLGHACKHIDLLERKGKDAIAADNTAAYVELMREKALFLAGLAQEATQHMHHLPRELRAKALPRLQRFSTSAQNALQLNSVFYMSALLFAEDHKEGQPHDLEIFTEQMRQSLSDS